ncbi:MAG: hypothetical protein M1831_004837 [Alyxoria varia]|nr:MAG: hypothetical protein M1831_004837 [Alyxoria varia]
MHLILTGATGLVGSACLHAMQRNPAVSKISILSRRPVPQATSTVGANPKLETNVIIQNDFSQPPSEEALAQLRDARGVVWAQGISVNQVDKADYEKITYDFPFVAAKAFAKMPDAKSDEIGEPHFNFVYVSGEGVTTKPGMLTPRFAGVKGRAEAGLLALSREEEYSRLRVYSARPGVVDPTGHEEIQEVANEKRQGMLKLFAKVLQPTMRVAYKDMVSPTRELGDAMVNLAMGDGKELPQGPGISGDGRTLGSAALRKLVGI